MECVLAFTNIECSQDLWDYTLLWLLCTSDFISSNLNASSLAFSLSSFSLYLFSCSARAFHFSMFLNPVAIWRSLMAGQIMASWVKIGMTTNWINPAYPPAMFVVVLSHIIEISRFWAFSISPWLKNSSKSKSAHWVEVG